MGRSMGKEKGRVGTKRTCADIGGRGFEKSKTLRTSLADGIHRRALACVTYWVAFGGGGCWQGTLSRLLPTNYVRMSEKHKAA